MWHKRFRRAATIAALTVIGTAVFPASAQAVEQCTGRWGGDPSTVGVAGEPVATTPEFHLSVCVSVADDPGSSVPAPSVYCYFGLGTSCLDWMEVSLGQGDFSAAVVTLQLSINGQLTEHVVSVPGPVPAEGRQCVFYKGPSWGNPGECLVFVSS